MSRPDSNPRSIVNSMQVVEAFSSIMERWLPLDLKETRIVPADVWHLLAYARARETSLDAAGTELARAPSANRVREVLRAALPSASAVQGQLNAALRAQLPRSLLKGKRSYTVAADCVLIPYHGQTLADDPEVLKAQAKSGTHHFHGYATLSIVHDRKRYVVALRVVRPHETMVAIVRDLLNRARRLGIRIRRICLDKEFYAIDVFRTLDRRGLSYIIPLPLRETLKKMCRGRHSLWAEYTLTNSRAGRRAYSIQIVLVRRHRRSPASHRRLPWLGYAVCGLPPGTSPRQVFEMYRDRFGIETTYRQMNRVRARTSSRSPVFRLLLVGLALILVNLYVALRFALRTPTSSRRAAASRGLTLTRLAALISRSLEALRQVRPVEQVRFTQALS